MILNFKMYKFFLAAIILITVSCSADKAEDKAPGNVNANYSNPAPVIEKENSAKPGLEEVSKPAFTYTFVSRKAWFKTNDSLVTDSSKQILADINRVDMTHLMYQDSIVVPSDFSGDRMAYLPFPINVADLADINKIIFFSYPTQTFAAYENGLLTRTGPTNMGRKNKKTPTGLFFTNWKAKESISTVDDEWILKWNFNIANFEGVGFHEYALPGYPASHSCLRLQSNDAQFLYSWANQWVLKNDEIKVPGTPVIVFGDYPFGKTRPWQTLVYDPTALEITRDALMNEVEPFKEKIIQAQQKRSALQTDSTSSNPV